MYHLNIDLDRWNEVVYYGLSPLYKQFYKEAERLFETDYNNAIDRLIDIYKTYLNGLRIQFNKFVAMVGPITDIDIAYGTCIDPGINETYIHGIINHYVLYNNILYFMFRSLIYSCSGIDAVLMMPHLVEDTLNSAKMAIKNGAPNDFEYQKEWVALNDDIFYYMIFNDK